MESKEILPAMTTTLEESTTEKVPLLLEEILKLVTPQNNIADSVQKDYLFIVIIVSMMENGFIPVDKDCQIIDYRMINTKQLSEWKNQSGVYEALFVLNGFKHISLKLIVSPLGAMALVNIVILDLGYEAYSVCLPISRYVVSIQATTIPLMFRDLKQLSLTLKNKMLATVKSRILSHHGYASASLFGLPEEVLFKIMLYLHIKDVLNVSKTCMSLSTLLQSDVLWHDMVKRDFADNDFSLDNKEISWKDVYKKLYIKKSNKMLVLRRRLEGSLHDHMDYADYVYNIDNPMWLM